MFVLKDTIHINAPIERCFLLSTSLAIVERELGMSPVLSRHSNRTEGLVVAGDRIHWRGWKFYLPQHHVSLISAWQPSSFFQDTMLRGRFRSFQHDHTFTEIDGHTLLKDAVRFSMPLGPLGKLVGKYLMVPHIRKLLTRRFALIKRIAESEEWRSYLPSAWAAQTASHGTTQCVEVLPE